MSTEKKRPYTIVHEPYLMDYLIKTYPPGTWRLNPRIGVPLRAVQTPVPPNEYRALKSWAPSADAIVVLPDKCVIIEADIRGDPKKLGALLIYRELVRMDPDWAHCHDKPIELVLLTPFEVPLLKNIAAKYGVKVVVYTPEFIWPYIMRQRPKERRSYGSQVVPP